MWWDGLLFFAFDDTKLARLEGKVSKFTDKFQNKKWLITTILGLLVGGYIIVSYVGMVGTEKSQTIGLRPRSSFSYDSDKILTVHSLNFFYVEQYLPHVQNWQKS